MSTKQAPRAVLVAALIVQVLTYSAWFSFSAHSGQTTIPWLMRHGHTLWGDVLEQHAPLTTLIAVGAQALAPAASVSTVARVLHIALALAVTLLAYDTARRLAHSAWAGAIAVGWWLLWGPVFNNILFYFDALLGALLLAALWLWLLLSARRRTLAAFAVGLALGLAAITKQHALAAIALGGLWLLWAAPRTVWAYTLAGALPTVLVAGWAAAQGTWDGHLFWMWRYNLTDYALAGSALSTTYSSFAFPSGDFARRLVLTWLCVPAFALGVFTVPRAQRPAWALALLLTVAGAATLFPRLGDGHVMGALPLVCTLSGVVLGRALGGTSPQQVWGAVRTPHGTLIAGVGGALAVAIALTTLPPYMAGPLGHGATYAYDEYTPVVEVLRAHATTASDTLFVLPFTDGTPQLLPRTGLEPPGTWVKGFPSYLQVPGIRETLLGEWATAPPTLVVVFPDVFGAAARAPLVAFVEAHYTLVAEFETIPLHGAARVWRIGTQ